MDEKKNQEVRQPSFWAVLPAPIRYDPELPAAAKLLYAEISALTEAKGYCFAGNDYFTGLFGMAERTLQRHLKALEKRGFIRIMDGDGGKARRKIFAGINPLAVNPDKNDGVREEPRQKCRGNPDKNVGVKDNNKNNKNPPKAPQGAAHEPEMFERFWLAYPRHKDKASARREWDRLKPDRKLMQEMSAALEKDKASDQWRRGIGIPYACRWLSRRRWEDGDDQELNSVPVRGTAVMSEEGLPWI